MFRGEKGLAAGSDAGKPFRLTTYMSPGSEVRSDAAGATPHGDN